MTSNRRTGRRRVAYSCIALLFFTLPDCLPVYADEPPVTSVVIIGDSIMREVSHSLERELAKHPGFNTFSFTSLRPGLSRLDLFDWLAKIDKITKSKKPDIIVIMMGADDRQSMQVQARATTPSDEPDWNQDGDSTDMTGVNVIAPDDPNWNREYARRVGAAMDGMITAGVKRIFWIELPDMRSAKLQEDNILINTLIQQEAASRPIVVFQPSKKLLSRKPGVFTPYIYDTNGMPLQVRDAEDVNLNPVGADILAREVISQILKTQDKSAP